MSFSAEEFTSAAWNKNAADVERMMKLVVRVLLRSDQINVNQQVVAHGGTALHAMLLAIGADPLVANNVGLTAHQEMRGTAIEVYKTFSEEKGLVKLCKQYPSVKEILARKKGTIKRGKKGQKAMAMQGGGVAESATEILVEKGIHLQFIDHDISPYFSGISPDWQPPLHSLSSDCWAAVPLIAARFEPNFSESEYYGLEYSTNIYLSPFDAPLPTTNKPEQPIVPKRTYLLEPMIAESVFSSDRPCDWNWLFAGVEENPFSGLTNALLTPLSKGTPIFWGERNDSVIPGWEEEGKDAVFAKATAKTGAAALEEELNALLESAASLFQELPPTTPLPPIFQEKPASMDLETYLSKAAGLELREFFLPHLEVSPEAFHMVIIKEKKKDDSSQSESTTSTTSATATASGRLRRRPHKLATPQKKMFDAASMSSETV